MGGNIIGEINFYSLTTDGSFPWMDKNPKLSWAATNYVQIPTKVTIHDLQGKQNEFDLDINGFEIHKYDGDEHNEFDDNSKEQQGYYEDIGTVLRKRLGASRVIISNHISRSRGPARPADECDRTHKNPVFYPHVDNDPPSIHWKVKQILGEEEAEKVMQNRFQVINV